MAAALDQQRISFRLADQSCALIVSLNPHDKLIEENICPLFQNHLDQIGRALSVLEKEKLTFSAQSNHFSKENIKDVCTVLNQYVGLKSIEKVRKKMLEADEADLVESLLANSRRERLEQTLKDIQQTKLSLDSISNVTGITIVELGGDL